MTRCDPVVACGMRHSFVKVCMGPCPVNKGPSFDRVLKVIIALGGGRKRNLSKAEILFSVAAWTNDHQREDTGNNLFELIETPWWQRTFSLLGLLMGFSVVV